VQRLCVATAGVDKMLEFCSFVTYAASVLVLFVFVCLMLSVFFSHKCSKRKTKQRGYVYSLAQYVIHTISLYSLPQYVIHTISLYSLAQYVIHTISQYSLAHYVIHTFSLYGLAFKWLIRLPSQSLSLFTITSYRCVPSQCCQCSPSTLAVFVLSLQIWEPRLSKYFHALFEEPIKLNPIYIYGVSWELLYYYPVIYA
jgi:heme/copper-type cytochrome/quinol oxidase subunit 2